MALIISQGLDAYLRILLLLNRPIPGGSALLFGSLGYFGLFKVGR
jgi:hypothetical protein